jgi:hypothetical protein
MKEDEFKQMAERAYYIRGLVINESIFIEKAIEYFIATHFCLETENRDLFVEQILTDNINLSAKINMFKKIINLKYENWSLDNPHIFKNLDKICTDRNILAHEVLDTSKYGLKRFMLNKELNFVKLNRPKRTVFDINYGDEIKQKISDTLSKIMLLNSSFKQMPFPHTDL